MRIIRSFNLLAAAVVYHGIFAATSAAAFSLPPSTLTSATSSIHSHAQTVKVAVKATAADLSSQDKATNNSKQHASPKESVDWESFSFSLNGVRTDKMWLSVIPVSFATAAASTTTEQEQYSDSATQCLVDFNDLRLSPASTVLNYGQVVFEGLKAFRRQDDTVVVFRPDRNAARMQKGAARFLLPPVPTTTFIKAVDSVVRSNARWVPPSGKGALYVRPSLMGTGEALGAKPSYESTFLVYCSPVGNYFNTGDLKAIRLQAVKGFSRAAPGGSGFVKASGNYAPTFLVQKEVRERGYDEVLCLDAATGNKIEEAGAFNFFVVFGNNNTIVTPSLESQTILDGVTRSSILELAEKECGYTVIEGEVTLDDLHDIATTTEGTKDDADVACEAFCCGTGASITPVGSVTVADQDGNQIGEVIQFGDGEFAGPVTRKLHKLLTDIQHGNDEGLNERYSHWIHVVEP